MNKYDRLRYLLYIFLLACLSMHAILINIDYVSTASDSNILYQFFLSLYPINFKHVILLFLFCYFYFHTYFDGKKICKFNVILGVVFSLCTIMGKCYLTPSSSLSILVSSFLQVYKFLLLFIGYYIIYYAIIKKVTSLDLSCITMKSNFFEKKNNKFFIILTFILILLCWLPYIIVYYPGGATGDTADSVFQFFHSEASWTVRTINLINPNVYINKHHSVLFTVILGMFMKFGNVIHSYNLGFFLYVIFQVFVLITIFTFLLYYMKKIKVPIWLIICSLIYICFSPIIIKYSITAVKDTLSAIFTLLYVIFLFQIVRNYNSIFRNKGRLLVFIITMLLVMMFKNNGVYSVFLSFIFLFVLYKNHWKYLLKVFLFVMIIFGMYDNLLLPSLGVSNGSIKEMMSVPFMQIARVAKYHEKDFSKKEIEQINEVLDFEFMKVNYIPDLVDNVKDTYKRDATREEVYNLFKIWFKYLKKYPLLYIDSFLNSSYGYIYPNLKSIENEPRIFFPGCLLSSNDFNLNLSIKFTRLRQLFNYFLYIIYSNVFTVYFSNIAFVDWVLILSFIFVIVKKQYKYLIPLLPLVSVLLSCFVSPVNGCIRYILSIVFSIPIIISIDFYVNSHKYE